MKYEQPIQIGTMKLDGRIIMPPMATRKSTPNGAVTDELIEYYALRAKESKVSMIITEYAYTSLDGRAHVGQMSIADDADLDAMKRMVDAIHAYGVKVMAQINHAGERACAKDNGTEAIAPSAVASPRATDQTILPRAMTKEEILRIEQDYVNAALRAKSVGYDAVEIHSAHGYLFNQFYSPITNKRDDEYGRQNIENATRIQCETIRKVREAVGAEYPLSIRLGGIDDMEGGSTVQDCVEACKLFEQAGVDMVDLTGGVTGYVRKGHDEAGYFQDISIPVKKVLNIPVLMTGGVHKLEEVEALLEQDTCDMVGVGRAMLAKADWYK